MQGVTGCMGWGIQKVGGGGAVKKVILLLKNSIAIILYLPCVRMRSRGNVIGSVLKKFRTIKTTMLNTN